MFVTACIIGGVGYACYHWGKNTKTVTTTTTTTTKDGETKVVENKVMSEKTDK